ncbi:MAG: GNAT family N-acetyltransferase [Gemmataceae bacterium]|nr:GNAT family N-acetyltransferase [Gemmataceae bacterium]
MDTGALQNLAAALAEASDANFVTHAGWVPRRVPSMRVLDRAGLVLVDSGLPCDTFNVICRARLERDTAAERVREAVAYFRQVRRLFSWWVGPADQPANLGELLLAAGLERAETELAMAADLATLQPDDGVPQGLRIERVRSEPELRDFARLSAANWTPPDPQVLRFYELAATVLLEGDCPLWLYVGYLEGAPVATAELALSGDTVGLYNLSTLAAYRRRGFGTALTRQPLLDAQERGFRTAVLQAAPDGMGVYRRLGFRSFGEITEYKPTTWGSDPAS